MNIKSKIFIVTFSSFFYFFGMAQAALQQPAGELPKNEPLQPLNEFVKPNISKNINYTPQPTEPESYDPDQQINLPNSETEKNSSTQSSSQPGESAVPSWAWPIVIAISIAVMLVIWKKYLRPNK